MQVTAHRVQGATLAGEVHVLLNGEFFAPGMAYVALSRVSRLSQLHLWGYDASAIHADPRVAAEYDRLQTRRLNSETVQGLLWRRPTQLSPLVQCSLDVG